MTIKPVDMQILVPRAGEVERINRTVQGQQQTDQQIMNQLIQEDIKQKEKIVSQLDATRYKKIDKEGKEKRNSKQEKDEVARGSRDSAEQQENSDKKKQQQDTVIGRHFDLKI
ncbi:MAG: hypothetical protein GX092_02150 [Clostridia bacterium]|jgi:hypothetical protein|nr:hypothetical protein [Clostridia bacterium]